MKKRRKLILLCIVLLLISIFLTYFVPLGVHNTAGDAKVLNTMGTYHCTAYCHTTVRHKEMSYGTYVYSTVDLTDDTYFRRATRSDLESVRSYTKDFSRMVEDISYSINWRAVHLIEHYDFAPRCISDGDYVYFQKQAGSGADDNESNAFQFYFFDTESQTMYYFEYIGGDPDEITWGSLPLLAGLSVIFLLTVPGILLGYLLSNEK